MDLLLPAITGITPVSETLRDTCTCALNPRNGGLGIVNPATVADSEYRFSTIINKELVSAILENRGEEFIPGSQSTLKAKREYKAAKIKMEEDNRFHLLSTCRCRVAEWYELSLPTLKTGVQIPSEAGSPGHQAVIGTGFILEI